MNNQPFSFPPPPPPPPQAGPYYPQPQDRSRDGYNDRFGRGGSGHRGRGRGNIRGGSRGGYAGNLGHASGYGGYPQADQRRGGFPDGQPNSYGGGSYPLPDYPQIQQPQYPSSIYSTYNQPPPQYPPSQPYPSPQYQSYPSYPSHGQPPAPIHHGQPQNRSYGYAPPNHDAQHRPQGHSRQPVLMGPPIHIGPDGRPTDHRPSSYGHPDVREVNRVPLGDHSPRSSGPTRHDSPNPFPGRGKKRNRTEAFRQPNATFARPQASPAVPSFGNPLPVNLPIKPPGSAPNGKKRKKKRRHNQLGLTPKTEEHESSEEEEDDQDEEAKLAAAANGQQGHTSTLQSSSEIAEWIAERKKKFPTQARAAEAAERKKKNDENQRAARQAAKESQEKRRVEARAKQEKEKAEPLEAKQQQDFKHNHQPATTAQDAKAAKAQSKIEKLRRRLEKEEKRAAKAQAKASQRATGPEDSADRLAPSGQAAVQAGETPQNGPEVSIGVHVGNGFELSTAASGREIGTQSNEKGISTEQDATTSDGAPLTSETPKTASVEASIPPNPLTPTSQPSIPDQDQATAPKELSLDEPGLSVEPDTNTSNHTALNTDIEDPDADTESDPSSSISSSELSSSSDDDEDTSSSGEFSSDEAPETATSKRTGPDKVPPPQREKAKGKDICRQFLRNGRCQRGEDCRFRHELPEKGHKSQAEKQVKAVEPKERKGLYQRLVEQEQEQEDQQILNTIVQLGDRGLLKEPISPEAANETQST